MPLRAEAESENAFFRSLPAVLVVGSVADPGKRQCKSSADSRRIPRFTNSLLIVLVENEIDLLRLSRLAFHVFSVTALRWLLPVQQHRGLR